jgi:small subunit ribosomal protein S4
MSEQRDMMSYIEVDKEKKRGVFKALPQRADLPSDINENLIVELYSK